MMLEHWHVAYTKMTNGLWDPESFADNLGTDAATARRWWESCCNVASQIMGVPEPTWHDDRQSTPICPVQEYRSYDAGRGNKATVRIYSCLYDHEPVVLPAPAETHAVAPTEELTLW